MKENLEWKEKSSKELLQTKVLSVTERTSTSPEGSEGKYIVLDAPDWVIVIPRLLNPSRFLMVKQWRHGSKSLSTEFPGGVIDVGEKPEQAAHRELLEETGHKANKLTHLGSFSPNPAIMSNKVHCFLAEELTSFGTQDLDPDEYVEYFVMEEETVFQNMGSSDFPHGLMVAALELYRQYQIS
ncbi:MAG: NUDIX hydrolase [Spirochaetaceae bacterium]|nr:NUDIX hydrolase [Spirochaetaceae bacterium]